MTAKQPLQETRLFSLATRVCAGLLTVVHPVLAQTASITFDDAVTDVAVRPMDPGAILPFDSEAHRLIDLQTVSMSTWIPNDAATDPFTGTVGAGGDFLRLDLVLRGLVNPPGSADPLAFEPFRFGDHPVYGFVEIDMDGDVDTGGELDAPQYRYLGNLVRFGGNTQHPEFRDRAAMDGSAFDEDFLTEPFVERHGEDFHLALIGGQFGADDIEEVVGNGNLIFETGETWNIRGPFFHRAHAYELFSFIEGGSYAGEYAPVCDLQFRHDSAEDRTHLTLVFPLTNFGAALMRDEPPEPLNQDPTDQASVLEGFMDLQLSAFMLSVLPTGLPEEKIIINWAEHSPADHLNPAGWTMTALLGTSYTASHATDVYYLWTDIYPNVVPGDVDGSGGRDEQDALLIGRYIVLEDISDGNFDGVVTIPSFAAGFSVFDVNYDVSLPKT